MENGKVANLKQAPYLILWWDDRTRHEKKLLIATAISLLLLVLILVLFLTNGPGVCHSSLCVTTSTDLLSHMDLKVDPCKDFYRFSCGNFLQNTNLDNGSSRSLRKIVEEDIQTRIRNMLEDISDIDDAIELNLARKFYRACMNESAIEADGLRTIKQIFKQIGGWPLLIGDNWRENEFDWKESVYKLRQIGINFDFFLILTLEKSRAQPPKYILTLKDPLYSPTKISKEVKAMYLDYMADVAVLFGAQRERARKEQQQVMQLLLSLAQISDEASYQSNGTKVYNPMSISELEYEHPNMNWFQYINNMLSPAVQITPDDVVSVPDSIYLKNMLYLINRTDKRILANFISWQTVQRLVNFLPAKILDKAYEYLQKVNGKYTKTPRWSICVNATTNRLEPIISAAYIKRYFNDDTRSRAMTLVRSIKMQFMESLYKLNWLDDETKDLVIEQLVESVENIASLPQLLPHVQLYTHVEVFEDRLLTSVLNLDYVNTNIEYGRLRERVTNNFINHQRFITGLNILFLPKQNILEIPVGIFQSIYYQKDRPEYMNYGALGSIIAHEISHIIIEAEYRDLQGELRSWWSPRTLLNYEEKLQCISQHYSNFTVQLINKRLNPLNTRDEDLADLIGMKIAYDAYLAWIGENGQEARLPGLSYSGKQLFWISSAIHHCAKYTPQMLRKYIASYKRSPEEFRVNGVLRNLQEFSDDFSCPPGSNMNPQNKCLI